MGSKIILLRHGQSNANLDPKYYSYGLDHIVSLTEEGIAQSVAAGVKIRDYLAKNRLTATALISSPLLRAMQTAALVGSFVDVPNITIADGLYEFCTNAVSHNEAQKGFQDPDHIVPTIGDVDYRYDGVGVVRPGRSFNDVREAVSNYVSGPLLEILDKQGDDEVAILVAHDYVLRAFLKGVPGGNLAPFENAKPYLFNTSDYYALESL